MSLEFDAKELVEQALPQFRECLNELLKEWGLGTRYPFFGDVKIESLEINSKKDTLKAKIKKIEVVDDTTAGLTMDLIIDCPADINIAINVELNPLLYHSTAPSVLRRGGIPRLMAVPSKFNAGLEITHINIEGTIRLTIRRKPIKRGKHVPGFHIPPPYSAGISDIVLYLDIIEGLNCKNLNLNLKGFSKVVTMMLDKFFIPLVIKKLSKPRRFKFRMPGMFRERADQFLKKIVSLTSNPNTNLNPPQERQIRVIENVEPKTRNNEKNHGNQNKDNITMNKTSKGGGFKKTSNNDSNGNNNSDNTNENKNVDGEDNNSNTNNSNNNTDNIIDNTNINTNTDLKDSEVTEDGKDSESNKESRMGETEKGHETSSILSSDDNSTEGSFMFPSESSSSSSLDLSGLSDI